MPVSLVASRTVVHILLATAADALLPLRGHAAAPEAG